MQIKRNTTEIQENKCGRTTDRTPINSVPTKNRDIRFYATPSNRNSPSTHHDDDEMRNRTRDTNNNNNWSSAKKIATQGPIFVVGANSFSTQPTKHPGRRNGLMHKCPLQ